MKVKDLFSSNYNKKWVLLVILIAFLSCAKDDEWWVEKNVFSEDKMVVAQYANNGKAHQSAAAYGDYAFFVTNRRSALYCYNLKTKSLILQKNFIPENERTIAGAILYHCNQMTFGPDFYDENDPFPLLYISQRAREDRRCIVEVYRLLPKWNDSLSEYESLETELIQMIYFPVLTDNNSLGRCNCVIDSNNKLMYTYSYNSANPYIPANPEGRLCRISSFKIPNYWEKKVYLEDNDILDSFSANYDGTNSQGGCIWNGNLFVAQGNASFGIYLNVYDLRKKELLSRIDLLASGIVWEPEGCFVYNDNIMISTGENIWEFHFE